VSRQVGAVASGEIEQLSVAECEVLVEEVLVVSAVTAARTAGVDGTPGSSWVHRA